jgi:hypothetical protein
MAMIDTRKIGKLGGESTLRRHGVDHYIRMGRASGDIRHAKAVAKREAKEVEQEIELLEEDLRAHRNPISGEQIDEEYPNPFYDEYAAMIREEQKAKKAEQ